LEKLTYLGLPNCYKLSNDVIDLIATTSVGPRILRYGFLGEENILGEIPEALITTELGDWRPWGGHRLWVAPEDNPRSYAPDNVPIKFEIINEYTIRLVQPADVATGIEKEMIIALDDQGTGVTISHALRNRTQASIEASAWAITIMSGGGEAILPQEPYRTWNEYLLPARPMVLWHYTDLSDPRWTINNQFVRLRTDYNLEQPQKIGVGNKQKWAAYHREQTLFVKRFEYQESRSYPDYGCNTEVYTAGSVIEVESLGPLQNLGPHESVEHVERWSLFDGVDQPDEILKSFGTADIVDDSARVT
jgi:hypothetical protein